VYSIEELQRVQLAGSPATTPELLIHLWAIDADVPDCVHSTIDVHLDRVTIDHLDTRTSDQLRRRLNRPRGSECRFRSRGIRRGRDIGGEGGRRGWDRRWLWRFCLASSPLQNQQHDNE